MLFLGPCHGEPLADLEDEPELRLSIFMGKLRFETMKFEDTTSFRETHVHVSMCVYVYEQYTVYIIYIMYLIF